MSPGILRRKILVADDLADAADLTAELLRLVGYDAVAVYDGLQAVETARSFKPDLAIIDIDMPVMDGYATAKNLRREQAPGERLILIAHTARTLPEDVQLALDAGFDRHVSKPQLCTALCDLIDALFAEKADQASNDPCEPGISARPARPSAAAASQSGLDTDK